jgi:hypothetical protein
MSEYQKEKEKNVWFILDYKYAQKKHWFLEKTT